MSTPSKRKQRSPRASSRKGSGKGSSNGSGAGASSKKGGLGGASAGQCNVRFIMSYHEDSRTEKVKLLGSVPQLGSWKNDGALSLKSSRNGNWFVDVMLPLGSKFQYRYMVVDESSGGVHYESGIQRQVSLAPEAIEQFRMAINVVDTWQFPDLASAGKRRVREEVTREHKVTSTILSIDDTDEGMQKEITELREAVEDAAAREKAQQGRIEKLTAELAAEKSRADKASAGLAAAATSGVEEMSAVSKERDELRARCADLEAQLESLQGLQGRVDELEAALKVRENEDETMRQAMLDAAAVASTEGKRADDLKKELVKAREEVSAHTETTSKLAGVLSDVKAECEELKLRSQTAIAETRDQFATMAKELLPRVAEKEVALSFAEQRVADLSVKLDNASLENRDLFNQVLDLKGNIRVFARIRPTLPGEVEKGNTEVITNPVRNRILVSNPHDTAGRPREFAFDRVFGSESTQVEVFDEVRPLVQSVLDGYNVCVFAYGQTGSGKTHTMMGSVADPGVNVRAITSLFSIIDERRGHWDYGVGVNMFEIYNEQVRDLLAPSKAGRAPPTLEVRQAGGKTYVEGLTEVEVGLPSEVQDVIMQGSKNRSVGRTDMNTHSSRSHLLMSVTITGINSVTGDRTNSTLYLVDLAGSERLSRSGATGAGLKEAQHINKSLSALGDVMNALQTKSRHVPFRNSKLTFLLQDALGGDAKCLMMCQVAPGSTHAAESTCTLNFALRAASVELGRAKKHETSGAILRAKTGLERTKGEVAALQADVDKFREAARAARSDAKKAAADAEAARAEAAKAIKQAARGTAQEVAGAQRELDSLKSLNARLAAQLSAAEGKAEAAQAEVAKAKAALREARSKAAARRRASADAAPGARAGDGAADAQANDTDASSEDQKWAQPTGAAEIMQKAMAAAAAIDRPLDVVQEIESTAKPRARAGSAGAAAAAAAVVVDEGEDEEGGDTFVDASSMDIFAGLTTKLGGNENSAASPAKPKGPSSARKAVKRTRALGDGPSKSFRVGTAGEKRGVRGVLGSSTSVNATGRGGVRGSTSLYDASTSAAARRRVTRASSRTSTAGATAPEGSLARRTSMRATASAKRRMSLTAARTTAATKKAGRWR